MSSHIIDDIEDNIYHVVVGWDNKFQTFFAELFESNYSDGSLCDEPSLTLGYPEQYQDVKVFADEFEQDARRDGLYGVYISNALQKTLEQDKQEAQAQNAAMQQMLDSHERGG